MRKEVLGIHQDALKHRLSCAKRYTDEQKRVILHAILVKGMPKSCAAKEFGVSRQIIWKWIRIFAQETGSTSNKIGPQHPLTVQNPIPMPRKNQTPAETPEEELARLRRENAQLQEALKMAEWTCHAKDVMIDLAEKTFNIPIRKKSGAKQ